MEQLKKEKTELIHDYLLEIMLCIKKYPETEEYVKEYLESVNLPIIQSGQPLDMYDEEYLIMYDDLLSNLNRKIQEEYENKNTYSK